MFKKITMLMVALVLGASFANAQIKPEAGSIGLGFRINGLANVAFNNWGSTGLSGMQVNDPLGIFPAGTTVDNLVPQEMFFGRYYLSSDLAIRVGLGINSLSAKTMTADSNFVPASVTTVETSTSAFSFGLGLGVEKHFASAASRIDPYAGAQINLGLLGGISQDVQSDTDSDPAVSQTITREWAGGSSFGVDLLAGFNYFFTDNFALGAEFSWGFGSASLGGDWSENTSTTTGSTTVETNFIGTSKMSQSGFRVGSTAGVNASIFW